MLVNPSTDKICCVQTGGPPYDTAQFGILLHEGLRRNTWTSSRKLGKRKAKAQLELSLIRDVKDNRKDFYSYVENKKKKQQIMWDRDNVSPLWKEIEDILLYPSML